MQRVIKNMSYQSERTIRRDRIVLLRERVAVLKTENAVLKTENAALKNTERYLEEAKEQVRVFNNHFILSN